MVDLGFFNFLNSHMLGTGPGDFQFPRSPNSRIGDCQFSKSSGHRSYRVRNLVGINYASKGPLLPLNFELKSSWWLQILDAARANEDTFIPQIILINHAPHAKYNVPTTLKIHGNLPNAPLKSTRRLTRNKLTIWHYKKAADVPAPLNAQPHSWLTNQTRLQLALYARRKYLGAYHYALCIFTEK